MELASRKTILASGPPTASTGRTYGCKRSDQTRKNSCGTGAVHIWVPAFAGTTILNRNPQRLPFAQRLGVARRHIGILGVLADGREDFPGTRAFGADSLLDDDGNAGHLVQPERIRWRVVIGHHRVRGD